MGRFSLGCLIAPAALFAAVAPAHAAISLMSGPSVFSQMSSPALDISSTADLGRTMARASNRASRVVGHSILFDAPGLDSDAADLVADVADVTAQAFENSALVLNGRSSRTRGKDCPLACMPFTVSRVDRHGISTVQTPYGRASAPWLG